MEQKRLAWLNDFVSNITQSNKDIITNISIDFKSFPYITDTFPYYTSSSFTNTYKSFLANLTHVKEPQYYHEAKNAGNWFKAIKQELDALVINYTWDFTNLPIGEGVLGKNGYTKSN